MFASWPVKLRDMSLLQGKRILVVDDEKLLRQVFRRLLKSQGADCFEAENITDAYQMLLANPIDILISDVRMPGGFGQELIQKINAQLPYKPRMFLCSGYNDLTEEQVKELGVIASFSKPFDSSHLLSVISAA